MRKKFDLSCTNNQNSLLYLLYQGKRIKGKKRHDDSKTNRNDNNMRSGFDNLVSADDYAAYFKKTKPTASYGCVICAQRAA